MAKTNFSYAQRFAIYTAHGEKCWLCGKAVELTDMEVDHVIPEWLAGMRELAGILKGFGLSESFDLNSYLNLMPAHDECNKKKGGHVFEATPLIQLALETCAKKEHRVVEALDAFLSVRSLGIAVTRILAADEAGILDKKHYRRLAKLAAIKSEPLREPENQGTPFAFAPGLTVVGDDGYLIQLRGRTGMVGSRPKGSNLHHSFDCPFCGPTGWNGTRCIQCGQLICPD
jgi:hypothetical protein